RRSPPASPGRRAGHRVGRYGHDERGRRHAARHVDRRQGQEVRRFFIVAALFAISCSSSTESNESAPDAVSDVASTDTNAPSGDSGESASSEPLDSIVADVFGDAPADMGTAFGPYPAGPYGNAVGSVMSNFQWEGYVNDLADAISNTKPYVASTSMD